MHRLLPSVIVFSCACDSMTTTSPEEGCRTSADCEAGEICNLGDCLLPCVVSRDCPPTERCEEGLCKPVSNPTCDAHTQCLEEGPCELLEGATCVAGECVYPWRPAEWPCSDGDACTANGRCDGRGACVSDVRLCNDPPVAECSDDNTTYEAYLSGGECDSSSGECIYARLDFPCTGCDSTCMPRCTSTDCPDREGGCERRYCHPDTGTCASSPAPNGTLCAHPVGIGFCQDQVCVRCVVDTDCEPDGDTCTAQGCRCGGNPACASNLLCDEGSCVCLEGERLCEGTCLADELCCANTDCPAGRLCEIGECVCTPGERDCGTSCVSAGGCCADPDCEGGRVCDTGECRCPDGQRLCSGVCTVTSAACCENEDCGHNGTCTGGVCSCGAGAKLCDDVCILDARCCTDLDCPGQLTCLSGACGCVAGQPCGDNCIPAGDCCTDDDCAGDHCLAGACVECLADERTCDGTRGQICLSNHWQDACADGGDWCIRIGSGAWEWQPLPVCDDGNACAIFEYSGSCSAGGAPLSREVVCWAIDDTHHFDTELVCTDGFTTELVTQAQGCGGDTALACDDTTHCSGECPTLDETRCRLGDVYQCQASSGCNRWVLIDTCDGVTPECEGDTCVECLAGTRECDAVSARVCEDNEWSEPSDCRDGDYCLNYDGGGFVWQSLTTCDDAHACDTFAWPQSCFPGGNPVSHSGVCWAIDDTPHYDTEVVCTDGDTFEVRTQVQGCSSGFAPMSCSDPCINRCPTLNQRTCTGGDVYRCEQVGACRDWVLFDICDDTTPDCAVDTCVACLGSERECDATSARVCQSNSWVEPNDCLDDGDYCFDYDDGGFIWQSVPDCTVARACDTFEWPESCYPGGDPESHSGVCWAIDEEYHYDTEVPCTDGVTLEIPTQVQGCSLGFSPLDCDDTALCSHNCAVVGNRRCNIDADAEVCTMVGACRRWVVEDCTGTTPVCELGYCVTCRNGGRQCNGTHARLCVDNDWTLVTDCVDNGEYCLNYNGAGFAWLAAIPVCNVAAACSTFRWPATCYPGGDPESHSGQCWAIDEEYHYDTELVCSNGSDFEVPTEFEGCSTGYSPIPCDQTDP